MQQNETQVLLHSADKIPLLVKEIFEQLDVTKETCHEYLQRVKPFLEYVQNHGLDHHTFLQYKRHLADRTDLGVSTKNKRFTTARILLRELNRRGMIPIDITQNVKSFQQSRKHKRIGLIQEEIDQLSVHLRQCEPTPQILRLKAILSLLLFQGMRQVEIVRLDVADLDLVSRTALVRGKGRDDKELIDLHPQTVIALHEYLKSNAVADGALFVSRSNNSLCQRLTTRGLRKIVKMRLAEAGISKHVHGFRHYFTTKLIESYKGDLLEVAKYTRHRSLEMLLVYNDAVKKNSDLPRYYETFDHLSFQKTIFCVKSNGGKS